MLSGKNLYLLLGGVILLAVLGFFLWRKLSSSGKSKSRKEQEEPTPVPEPKQEEIPPEEPNQNESEPVLEDETEEACGTK
jgi:hypothetical protein